MKPLQFSAQGITFPRRAAWGWECDYKKGYQDDGLEKVEDCREAAGLTNFIAPQPLEV